MATLQSFINLFRPSRSSSFWSWGGTRRQNAPYTVDRAKLNSTWHTIVSRIITTSTAIPWQVVALNKDENAQALPDHPLTKLLYRPNPFQSRSEFLAQALVEYYQEGNLYLYFITNKNGLNRGQTKEIYVLPAHTEVLKNSSWLPGVSGYRVARAEGGYDTFTSDEVLHFKNVPVDVDGYGTSHLRVGLQLLKGLDTSRDLRNHIIGQGGPDMALSNAADEPETLTPDQLAQAQAGIEDMSGRKFFNQKMTANRIGLTPQELDLLNAARADTGMLADLLNYPAQLLSTSEGTTFSNVSEAQKALYTNCILPLLMQIRDGLNYKLGGSYGDKAYIDLDLSGIEVLRENRDAQKTAAMAAGALTVNEMRKEAGLAALKEGGDGFLRSASYSYFNKIDEVDTTPAPTYEIDDDQVGDE